MRKPELQDWPICDLADQPVRLEDLGEVVHFKLEQRVLAAIGRGEPQINALRLAAESDWSGGEGRE